MTGCWKPVKTWNLQILTDPAGNSFIQNRYAPEIDPDREVTHFVRSREQDHALGIYTQEEVSQVTGDAPLASTSEVSTRSTATPTADAVLLKGDAQLEATEGRATITLKVVGRFKPFDNLYQRLPSTS